MNKLTERSRNGSRDHRTTALPTSHTTVRGPAVVTNEVIYGEIVAIKDQMAKLQEAILTGSNAAMEHSRDMAHSMRRLETQNKMVWKTAEQKQAAKTSSW